MLENSAEIVDVPHRVRQWVQPLHDSPWDEITSAMLHAAGLVLRGERGMPSASRIFAEKLLWPILCKDPGFSPCERLL